MMVATLKDVAKLACVDISTVSRALNNSSYVHPETKARIFEAVKQLSYQPNLLAKGLRQGKRHTIGVVVPNLHMSIFAEITHGIEEIASKKGYATLICITEDNPDIEKECLNRLRNGFVDGLIIASTGYNKQLIRDIKASGLPITQIIRNHDPHLNSVLVDYHKCGYDAVYYLFQKGCQHIGLINGTMKLAPYKERYLGYKKAIEELGLQEYIHQASGPVNTLEYGYHSTMNLLATFPQLDAIIAPVDTHAIGAFRAIKDNGKSVPQHIKLISLTGQTVASMLETSLSAMEMPGKHIGMSATEMVLEDIESDASLTTEKHLVYRSTLVERESTQVSTPTASMHSTHT